MNIRKILSFSIIIAFVLMIFQYPLYKFLPDNYVLIVNYIDEILVGIFALIILVKCFTGLKLLKYERSILIWFIGLMILGIISTSVSQIQPHKAIIEDIISCCKFVIPYIGVRLLIDTDASQSILKILVKLAKIISVFLFILLIIDFLLPNGLFESGIERNSFRSVQLFYQHPASLAYVGFLIIALLSLEKQKVAKYKVMIIVVIFSTLRTRAIGFLFIYIIISMFKRLFASRFKYLLIFFAIFGAILIGYDSIYLYYLNPEINSAREILTINSINLANNYFPFGAGFATYGSAAAAKYYSPIYLELGFNLRYGLSQMNSSYLTDTFWPILFGQFGYLGVFIFGRIVIQFLKICTWFHKEKNVVFVSCFTLFGYLLVSTLGSSSYFNPVAVVYGITMALIITSNKK